MFGDAVSNSFSETRSMSFGVWYGVLIKRDNGEWNLYFNPSDPRNPQESELVGTSPVGTLTDMSNGGIVWQTSHRGSPRYVRRMEIF